MIDVLMDEEDIVIYPRCHVEGCNREIRNITYDVPEAQTIAEVLVPNATFRFDTIAQPCGHVQPSESTLTWVTRDAEPDCGV
jgi:hypothetical protein